MTENTQPVRPMGETSFKQIGNGFIGQKNEQSPKYIRLALDKEAQKLLTEDDFARGIFIFKSDRKDKNQNPIYDVSARMPISYEKESRVV